MKAYLLFKDRDFGLDQPLPWNELSLVQDLELSTLFDAMASGDKFLLQVAHQAILSAMENDPETILYRQNVLKDCLKNPTLVAAMYQIAVEAIDNEKKIYWGIFSKYPIAILDRAINVLRMFVEMLIRLRNIADEHREDFESDGFLTLFTSLTRELSDEYLATIQDHLKA
ncbi:MAG: DNA mismatch repair protein MutS, partial [Chloroflexi bacterium]|nr:DNA mismatch repair protein MutS [Chloroflexota bacterium]